jgi:hypothetical protein
MIKNLVLLATSLVLASCASTDMTSVRGRSEAQTTYFKILVMVPFSDLESRIQAEHIFVAELNTYLVTAQASITILPPTEDYDEEGLLQILNEARVDGILIVTLTDSYTSDTYVPQSSTTTGSATLYGNIANYSAQTQYSGGYYLSKPRVHYELRLLNVDTGDTEWLATSLTRGNAYAGFKTMIKSLAHAAADKLQEDGVIQ